jgi:hypothetical protein
VENISQENASTQTFNQAFNEMAVDPRITYPCYKSFDEFIDVERLKSLDGYITERISQYIAARKENYFLNAYRLEAASPHQPGAREIWLSKPNKADDYDKIDNVDIWKPTEDAKDFPLLMEFIETLPFKAFGRMLIIYDDAPRPVPAHRDHLDQDTCYDFVWLRTNLKKPFYMLNHKTSKKLHVKSYSAWFDAVNQFHGVDEEDGLSFSLRIDGIFTDEFKAKIPKPHFNAASTPALWACLSERDFARQS